MWKFSRYPSQTGFTTLLDATDDLLNLVSLLTAPKFIVKLCSRHTQVPANERESRAKKIALHVKIALSFFEQALRSNSEVSFLPLYYGVLNLLKVYILFSRRAGELESNRWHGAKYSLSGAGPRSLFSDSITVLPKGTIPLFFPSET